MEIGQSYIGDVVVSAEYPRVIASVNSVGDAKKLVEENFYKPDKDATDIVEIPYYGFSNTNSDQRDLKLREIKQILDEDANFPIIVSLRMSDDGEQSSYSQYGNKDTLQTFERLSEYADAFEIEVDSEIFENLIRLFENKDLTCIVADYGENKILEKSEAGERLERLTGFDGADIIKIGYKVASRKEDTYLDVKDMFNIAKNYEFIGGQRRPVSVVPSNEAATQVFSSLFGSCLTNGSLGDNTEKNNQPSVRDLSRDIKRYKELLSEAGIDIPVRNYDSQEVEDIINQIEIDILKKYNGVGGI